MGAVGEAPCSDMPQPELTAKLPVFVLEKLSARQVPSTTANPMEGSGHEDGKLFLGALTTPYSSVKPQKGSVPKELSSALLRKKTRPFCQNLVKELHSSRKRNPFFLQCPLVTQFCHS